MGLIYRLTKGLPSGGLFPSTLDEFLEKVEKMKMKNGEIEEFKVKATDIPTWGAIDDEEGLCGWNGYPVAIEFVLDYTVIFTDNRKIEFTESLPIHLSSIDPARISFGRQKQIEFLVSKQGYLKARDYTVQCCIENTASAYR